MRKLLIGLLIAGGLTFAACDRNEGPIEETREEIDRDGVGGSGEIRVDDVDTSEVERDLKSFGNEVEEEFKENVADPILVTDDQSNIIMMNEEAERLFQVREGGKRNYGAIQAIRGNDTKFTSFISEFTLGTAISRRSRMTLTDPSSGRELPVEVVSGKIINEHGEPSVIVSVVHDLTIQLDDVVDGIQAVAETMVIYGVDRPTDEARQLAGILAEQADSLLSALRKLDGLKDLESDLVRVHELEHDADTLSRAAVARLFRDSLDALEVIKWRDLYRELENAIDAAEDAAEAIERMFHKAT